MSHFLEQFVPTLPDDLWIVGVSAMTSVACALLGCYLVLRRMSLLGDALSHAVLPGLVLAFIFTGSLAIEYMFVGAFVIGLLTTFLIQSFHRLGNVPADASMGVVFTSLFALGVVLIRRYAQGVDLDADCVLYGQLVLMPHNHVELLGYSLPRAAVSIAPMLVVNTAVVLGLWKELKISSFDPALATTMGFRAGWLHYLLMGLVAATAVGSFEAVGSILVIAMLIIPAATAHLLCDRLGPMMFVAALVGMVSAYFGWLGASQFNTEPAGMMAVAAGACYGTAFLFAPRYGVVSTLVRNLQTSARIVREDILAMLYRLEEAGVKKPLSAHDAVRALGGGLLARWSVLQLRWRGQIERDNGDLRLLEPGRRAAVNLVRSHRLWEAYLVEHLDLPPDHVHDPAERMEHYITPKLQEQLAADLSESAVDPHGREIPAPPK